jgi:extracellular elastinolytic metalloproteinase
MSHRNEKNRRKVAKRKSHGASNTGRGNFRRVFESLEDRTLLTASYQPPQHFLVNYDGYLTGPSAAPPLQIAQDYLRSSANDLGILASDLNNALVTTNYVTASTGATTLTLQQSLNGLPVFNAYYNVTVTSDGRVLSAGGGFVPGLSQKSHTSTPLLGVQQAVISGASMLGYETQQIPTIISQSSINSYLLRATAISLDDIRGNLHYVPVPGNDVSLSWEMTVRTPDGDHWYNASVDANSGQVNTLIDYMNNAQYEVYASPGENPDTGPRTIATNPDIISPTPAPVPSPFGWHDTDGAPGAEQTITSGNNVNAYTDRDADGTADAGSQPDGGANLDFSGALVTIDLNQEPSTYSAAAVVNLFYWTNILHDVHYLYGFDEAARNFQVNNYGRGGTGSDAVKAEAQDGSGTNNANFATPPDGTAPTMQMYEWDVTTPRRDGDFDNGIIIHEYGHGVSNRLTGNGVGLFQLQSRGMGEGWSDFWALMLTQKSAAETTAGRGIGTYALGQPTTGAGIRDFKYDFDITNQNLETFLNFGTGPGQSVAVHDAGTRWAAALWDINHLLTERYGYESNVYNSTSNAGNIKTLQLVMNALKIQPLNPTFIESRDAVLAADKLLYNGANQLEIWTAFARRGLGELASTSGSAATVLTTSFQIPASVLVKASFNGDVSNLEGDSGSTFFVFTVSLNRDITAPVVVTYETADNTAIAGLDYTSSAGTLTFEAGQSASQSITVEVSGDVTVESNESFLVRLTSVTGGAIGDSEASGIILNDDVDVSIGDATIVEGSSGAREIRFAVTTFGDVNKNIVVNFSTLNSTADGAIDYLPRAGSMTLTPQSPNGSIAVPIVADILDEDDEQFFVMVTGIQGARVADGTGVATIFDDDALPSFYVNDVQITTTDAGNFAAVFTVGLDAPAGRTVTVNFATVDQGALAGSDYQSLVGALSFAPGQRTRTVAVPITTGAVYSPDKKFGLALTSPTNSLLADPMGIATIVFASGPANERIIDNGDVGYSRSINGWTTLTNTLAYGLDYDYHTAGNGSSTASYTFTGLANGSYQVLAKWIPFSNRATNAPFTILNGATPINTVLVNQQLAPAGEVSNGITWQSLGTFDTTTGTLVVRLGDNANGYIIADAIRLVPGGIGAQSPEINIASSGISIATGDTVPSAVDGTDFGITALNTDSAAHTFTVVNNGNAVLNLGGLPRVAITGAAAGDFFITAQPGASINPSGSTNFVIVFRPTAAGLRQATVTIANNDSDEGPYSFTIQGTGEVIASPFGHNADLPQDVNADDRVSTSDVLILVNSLLRNSASPLTATATPAAASSYYLDVSGDGRVSTNDLLMVVNYILRTSAAPQVVPAAAIAEPLSSAAVDATFVLFDDTSDSAKSEAAPQVVVTLAASSEPRNLTSAASSLLTAAEVSAAFAGDDDDGDEANQASADDWDLLALDV